MANGIDWFRWHHGSVNDPKFGLVAKKAGARVGDVIAIWALVLEQASASTERGQLTEIDCEATDFLLGADDGTTARILEAMKARGLLSGDRVTRWDDRQPKRERVDNTAAERKRAQRGRDTGKDGGTTDDEPCHTMSHHVTPREEKRREEELPHTPQAGLPPKSRSNAIALQTYLATCKAQGIKPIPEDDSVFAYAEKAGISQDFLRLQWLEFKDRYSVDGAKRYRSWPSVFGKAVRGNWFKLWYASPDGGYALTTTGQQAKRIHDEGRI